MEGRVFGLLTVVAEVKTSKSGKYYLCQCRCGQQKEVRGTALRSGHSKSCGCQQMSGMRRKGRASYTDISGKKFGKLTAVERVETPGLSRAAHWRCLCDCGNYVTVRGGLLVSGNNKSCGCAGNMSRPKDITGGRFGRLVAIERTAAKSGTSYLWLCKCDCGEYISVSIRNLASGHTKSCGCSRKTA